MAELRFKVKADITKVSELRKEIERLEGALRRMSKSADGAAFEKVVEKLSSTRKELQGMVKEAAKTGAEFNKSLEAPLSNTASNMDKLNEAIRVQNIEEKRLGQTIRDLKLDRRDIDKESADYEHLNTKIRELEAARNKEKDLLFALREEKKKITAQNRLQTVSEEQIDKIMKSQVLSIRDAETQNKLLRRAVKDVVGADNEAYLTRQKLNARIDDNTNFIRRNTDAMIQQKMGIGGYKQAINEAFVSIKNGTNVTKNLGVVASSTAKIMGSSLKGSMQQIQMSVGSMIKGFVGAQAIISGFNKLIGAIRSGVNSIVDFEQANSNLAAILQTNIKGIQTLTYDAKRLGAITRYTASEVTGLQIELAKLGFTRSEILDSTGAVLKFAQATGANLSQAAKLTGSSLRSFNASTTETERYVSAMAVATTKSALSFDYLDNAMSTVAPVAKSFNLSIEDTLALLGSLSDAGFDASSSATATRNILLNLADANGKLAKALGGNARTLPEIVKGLQELRNRGIDLNETLELTDKRSVAAFNTFLEGSDKILKLRDSITGVGDELDAMAITMEDNVAGAIAGLQSAWEAFMLSFSSSTGTAKKVIDFFSRGLRNISNQLASPEQRLAMRVADAESFASDQLKEFKVIERNTELLKELYQSKLDAGLNANDAEIAARREFATKYESELKKEEALYAKILEERDKTQEKYDKASFIKQGLFLEKTDSWYKKKIKGQEAGLVELSASMYKHKAILDAINETTLKEDVNDVIVPKKELTQEEIRDAERISKERVAIEKAKQDALIELIGKIEKDKIDLMDDGFAKRRALIAYNYNQELKQIEEQRKKSGLDIDSNEAEEARANAADRRFKAEESLQEELLGKYKTFEQRKTDINAQFDLDRRELEKIGNKEAIQELERQRKESIQRVNDEESEITRQTTDVFIKLFKDASTQTISEIKGIIGTVQELYEYLENTKIEDMVDKFGFSAGDLAKMKGDSKVLKDLLDGLTQKKKELADRNPTEAFNQSISEGIDLINDGDIAGGVIKITKAFKDAMPYVRKFADGLNEAFGVDISALLDATDAVLDMGTGIAQLASGDIIGGASSVMSSIGSIVSLVTSADKEHREALMRLERERIRMANEYNLILIRQEDLLKKTANAFGEQQIEKASIYLDQYRKAFVALDDAISGRNGLKQLEEEFKDGSNILKKWGAYNELRRKGLLGIGNIEIVTGSKKSGGILGIGRKQKDVYSKLSDVYDDLIDKEGRLNKARVQTILNNRKMSDAHRDQLENMLALAEEMEKAEEAMRSYIQTTYGGMGDSAVNSIIEAMKDDSVDMWDSFRKGGEQAIEALGQQILYQKFFSAAFDKFGKEIEAVYAKELSPEDLGSEITSLINKFYSSIQGKMEGAKIFAEEWQKQAEEMGFDIWKQQADKMTPTVGRGFETMTQDQASELTGRFTANNMLLEAIRNGQENFTESIVSIDVNMGRLLEENVMTRNIADEILEYNVKSFMELQDIRNNTGTVVEPIKEMSRDIADLKNEFRKQFF